MQEHQPTEKQASSNSKEAFDSLLCLIHTERDSIHVAEADKF